MSLLIALARYNDDVRLVLYDTSSLLTMDSEELHQALFPSLFSSRIRL